MDWYAVQTQPNRENQAATPLERQVFDVCSSSYEQIARHACQVKNVSRLLFPGFGSINVDDEKASWRSINGIISVKNIFSFEQKLSVVESEFNLTLRPSERSIGFIDTCNGSFKLSQKIEIVSITLSGQIGKLLSLYAGNLATILFRMLGRIVRGQIERKVGASL